MFTDDFTGANEAVALDGLVDSTCFSSPATYDAQSALSFTSEPSCPLAGTVLVGAAGQTDHLSYTDSGGVQIDTGNNSSTDQTYPSCTDSQLLACPAGP